MVQLSLDPADFSLDVTVDADRLTGVIRRKSDGQPQARFTLDPTHPHEHIEYSVAEPGLPLSDAVFLISVLFFTEHLGNQHLHSPLRLTFVSPHRPVTVAHPPRIETTEALLGGLSVPDRIAVLVAACEIAVPVWRDWAQAGELTYFDGLGMSAVSSTLAQSTIAAVRGWLKDGDTGPLQAQSSEYRALHWPMIEDEWAVPQNVYYSLFAPCNLARCAIKGGDIELALVCIRQATAARATNRQDDFLGEPFRRAFLLEWWRAALGLLL